MNGCGYPSSRWPDPGRVIYATWPGLQWLLSNAMTPLAALPTTPGHARALVRAALFAWNMSNLTETAELVVTELVTNAVRASERSGRSPSCQAGGFPVLREASADSECGRGLALVDAMTEGRWGWHPGPRRER
jgi:hypothetical protein